MPKNRIQPRTWLRVILAFVMGIAGGIALGVATTALLRLADPAGGVIAGALSIPVWAVPVGFLVMYANRMLWSSAALLLGCAGVVVLALVL